MPVSVATSTAGAVVVRAASSMPPVDSTLVRPAGRSPYLPATSGGRAPALGMDEQLRLGLGVALRRRSAGLMPACTRHSPSQTCMSARPVARRPWAPRNWSGRNCVPPVTWPPTDAPMPPGPAAARSAGAILDRGGRARGAGRDPRAQRHLVGGDGDIAGAALGDREDPDLGMRGADAPDRGAVQSGARPDLGIHPLPPQPARRPRPPGRPRRAPAARSGTAFPPRPAGAP